MEYLLGSIVTILAIAYASKRMSATIKQNKLPGIRLSQSHVHEMVKLSIIKLITPDISRPTQASKLSASLYTRVIFMENKAYWIKNNGFYVANMEDGVIDNESAKIVDTMGMDDVELDKMIFIVDTLTEGNANDNRNSGHKEL
jgi:negative regulator of sigma E activity